MGRGSVDKEDVGKGNGARGDRVTNDQQVVPNVDLVIEHEVVARTLSAVAVAQFNDRGRFRAIEESGSSNPH